MMSQLKSTMRTIMTMYGENLSFLSTSDSLISDLKLNFDIDSFFVHY